VINTDLSKTTNKSDFDFTLITPTLNAEKWIKKLLDSIAEQESDLSIQHIVVDGGSNDNTLSILREHQIEHYIKEGYSIYEAHNYGIKKSKGKLIGFINCDDKYSSKDVLIKVKEEYLKNPKVDLIYGNCNFVNSKGKILYTMKPPRNFNPTISKLRTFNISHPSWFAHRSVFSKIGFYDTQWKFVSDMDFILRAINYPLRFKKIDLNIADFLRHEENASSSKEANREGVSFFMKVNGNSKLKRVFHTFLLGVSFLRDYRYLIFYFRRFFKIET